MRSMKDGATKKLADINTDFDELKELISNLPAPREALDVVINKIEKVSSSVTGLVIVLFCYTEG